MKYLLLSVLLLTGCSDKYGYTLLSCNKYGCEVLAELVEEVECLDAARKIANLHQNILKDKPSKALTCVKKVL